MYLKSYPFLLDFQICWHITVFSNSCLLFVYKFFLFITNFTGLHLLPLKFFCLVEPKTKSLVAWWYSRNLEGCLCFSSISSFFVKLRCFQGFVVYLGYYSTFPNLLLRLSTVFYVWHVEFFISCIPVWFLFRVSDCRFFHLCLVCIYFDNLFMYALE